VKGREHARPLSDITSSLESVQRSSLHLKSGAYTGSDCPGFPPRILFSLIPDNSSGNGVHALGKYRFNRSFFENTRFNQNKTLQNSNVLGPFLVLQDSLYRFRAKVAPKPANALILMDEKIWVLIDFFGKKPLIYRFFYSPLIHTPFYRILIHNEPAYQDKTRKKIL